MLRARGEALKKARVSLRKCLEYAYEYLPTVSAWHKAAREREADCPGSRRRCGRRLSRGRSERLRRWDECWQAGGGCWRARNRVCSEGDAFAKKPGDGIDIWLEAAEALYLVCDQFEKQIVFFGNQLRPCLRERRQHLPTSGDVSIVFTRCGDGGARGDLRVAEGPPAASASTPRGLSCQTLATAANASNSATRFSFHAAIAIAISPLSKIALCSNVIWCRAEAVE